MRESDIGFLITGGFTSEATSLLITTMSDPRNYNITIAESKSARLLKWLSLNTACKIYTITHLKNKFFLETGINEDGFVIVFDSRTTPESIDDCLDFINNIEDNG